MQSVLGKLGVECCVLSESEYLISESEQHSTPNLPNTDCIVRKNL